MIYFASEKNNGLTDGNMRSKSLPLSMCYSLKKTSTKIIFFRQPGGNINASDGRWSSLSDIGQHVCAQQQQTRPESEAARPH